VGVGGGERRIWALHFRHTQKVINYTHHKWLVHNSLGVYNVTCSELD
jgi:hypothetical protein